MIQRRMAPVWLLALALVGCGEDVTGPQLGDVTGVWDATSYRFTDTATLTKSAELIGGGTTLTLTIESLGGDPTLIAVFDDPVGGNSWTRGGGVDRGRSEITIGGGTFFVEHSGDEMTLTLQELAVFNFGDGAEAANVTMDLTRR